MYQICFFLLDHLFRNTDDESPIDILNVTCVYNNMTKSSNWKWIVSGKSIFSQKFCFLKFDYFLIIFIIH